jgi:hypothetical protein
MLGNIHGIKTTTLHHPKKKKKNQKQKKKKNKKKKGGKKVTQFFCAQSTIYSPFICRGSDTGTGCQMHLL